VLQHASSLVVLDRERSEHGVTVHSLDFEAALSGADGPLAW
jgi:hypothetical protein